VVRTLEFRGVVRPNKGRFAEDMVIPGKHAMSSAPDDWPLRLEPGTLNVGINDDGFPASFTGLGKGEGLKKLDNSEFRPAFVIHQADIVNNTVRPTQRSPLKGTAQVWRARLQVVSSGQEVECWVLRRIGSGIASQIELVSDKHLRTHLGLMDGTNVIVTMIEGGSEASGHPGRLKPKILK
jgi:hypothetical protein